jgi:hypothetical protein
MNRSPAGALPSSAAGARVCAPGSCDLGRPARTSAGLPPPGLQDCHHRGCGPGISGRGTTAGAAIAAGPIDSSGVIHGWYLAVGTRGSHALSCRTPAPHARTARRRSNGTRKARMGRPEQLARSTGRTRSVSWSVLPLPVSRPQRCLALRVMWPRGADTPCAGPWALVAMPPRNGSRTRTMPR